uniref:Uncharacterized protein n=1 Tax=Timema tahoe TaxID=61484 RepID=A0A7R9IHH8_9NEOP|nr:unnamed protein product [Timema tahoe]
MIAPMIRLDGKPEHVTESPPISAPTNEGLVQSPPTLANSAATAGMRELEFKVYLHLHGQSGTTTLRTPDQDSNLDLPIIHKLIYCKSSTLDHETAGAGSISSYAGILKGCSLGDMSGTVGMSGSVGAANQTFLHYLHDLANKGW